MSIRIFVASAILFLTAAPAFSRQEPETAKKPALGVGSPAPALAIEKWVKGAPIASFEKGKSYVVEFWATWCGPCIASMPHLSELQRQFKDKGVTMIGVTCKDPNNDLAAVETMVKEKGAGMDYTVAWDADRKTFEAYMKAAGQNGIPCSFVVDGTGKIAYIGHPMFLDLPLEQLVSGTWDPEKGGEMIADAQKRLSEIEKSSEKDPKNAIAMIAEFEAKFPAYSKLVLALKFQSLLSAGDFTAAYASGAKLVDEAIAQKNAANLNTIAWMIVDPDAKWAKLDLDLALKAAEKGVAFTQETDGAVLDTLARVHFLKGNAKKAVECETKAVAVSKGKTKELFEKTLADYKAKASQ